MAAMAAGAAPCSTRPSQSSGGKELRSLILFSAVGAASLFEAFGQTVPAARSDDAIFERAMAAINAGDGAAALPLLKDLEERHPDSFEINESLGLIYAGENDLARALPLMAAAASERPDSEGAAVNLGIAYLKAARNQEAAHELERALTINPDNVRAEEALGQAWMELHQPAKAAAVFEKALALDRTNPTLTYNAALADFNAGDAAGARELLARMGGAENSPEVESLYADVEERLGDYKQAGEHYLHAARLAPTEPNEYVLGVEFLRHWTFPAAIAEFEGAQRLFPDSRRIRLGLGIAYFGNHNFDQALAVFESLFEEGQGNQLFRELLGRTCAVEAEGNSPRCSTLVAYAMKHPEDGKTATYAAISILHQSESPEQVERARRLLDVAIHASPELPDAHYEMGLLLEQEGNWQESVRELETAIRLKPDYASAHYRLALAYRHTGQREKAEEEIRLRQKYSDEEARERDTHLEQIQTLLVTMR